VGVGVELLYRDGVADVQLAPPLVAMVASLKTPFAEFAAMLYSAGLYFQASRLAAD
jgi:hypothetical protein